MNVVLLASGRWLDAPGCHRALRQPALLDLEDLAQRDDEHWLVRETVECKVILVHEQGVWVEDQVSLRQPAIRAKHFVEQALVDDRCSLLPLPVIEVSPHGSRQHSLQIVLLLCFLVARLEAALALWVSEQLAALLLGATLLVCGKMIAQTHHFVWVLGQVVVLLACAWIPVGLVDIRGRVFITDVLNHVVQQLCSRRPRRRYHVGHVDLLLRRTDRGALWHLHLLSHLLGCIVMALFRVIFSDLFVASRAGVTGSTRLLPPRTTAGCLVCRRMAAHRIIIFDTRRSHGSLVLRINSWNIWWQNILILRGKMMTGTNQLFAFLYRARPNSFLALQFILAKLCAWVAWLAFCLTWISIISQVIISTTWQGDFTSNSLQLVGKIFRRKLHGLLWLLLNLRFKSKKCNSCELSIVFWET